MIVYVELLGCATDLEVKMASCSASRAGWKCMMGVGTACQNVTPSMQLFQSGCCQSCSPFGVKGQAFHPIALGLKLGEHRTARD